MKSFKTKELYNNNIKEVKELAIYHHVDVSGGYNGRLGVETKGLHYTSPNERAWKQEDKQAKATVLYVPT